MSRYFVCVKVNGDDQSLGRYVKQTYGVRGYPTILVLYSNGALKKSLVGYRDASRFASDISQVIQQ